MASTSIVSLTMEPENGSIDLSKTALLIIDMQKDFLEEGGFGESLGNDLSKLQRAIEPCRRLLDAVRTHEEMLILHTREGHRSDLSDVHAHKNKSGVIGSSGNMGKILIRREPGHDIIETLYPRSGEPIIDKPGKGSFYATDLECILQVNGISTLLVCGVTTEVCVHTTVREANDRGYHCIVVGDACASYSDEFHDVALRMISSQGGIFGSVTSSDNVIAAITNVNKDCEKTLNEPNGVSPIESLSNDSKRETPNIFASQPKYVPGQTPSRPSLSFGKSKQVFNPAELASAYNLMISSVTPRPIALVSSRSEDGIDNVAPFSYFGAMAHDPPMLSIGFCRKGRDRVMKDSLVNIIAQQEFAVNIISEWYIDAANHACGMFPPDVDEFNVSGLTKVDDCEVVNAPRVGEAAVTYECKLEHAHAVKNDNGDPTTEIVLARVARIHVDHSVLVNDFDPTKPEVDTLKLRPVGRLGGNVYTSLGDTVDIPRPKVG